ncbi:hypothetical protein D3C85_1154080 [compost metagenome]
MVSICTSSPFFSSRVARDSSYSPKLTLSSSLAGAPGTWGAWRRRTALIRASNSRGLNGLAR